MQKELPNSQQLSDANTVGDLQILASRTLCALILNAGPDAIKVLGLHMISAGGNNRLAIELLHSQYQKYGR